MQQYLTAVDLREEIAAEKRREQERDGNDADKAPDEQPAMLDGERQEVVVPGAQPYEERLEGALEAHQGVPGGRRTDDVVVLVDVGRVRAQQIFRHRRNQRARQQERADHGEHHAFRHRHEQEARHAAQEEHRYEHDADAQQGHESRYDDL